MSKLFQNNYLKRFTGAVRSKHPAAYLGITIKAISPITRVADLIVQGLRWQRLPVHTIPTRCIFIVCPPRSGGTIVYQALTRALPSVYLSNLHALFPYFGTRLCRVGGARFKPQRSFNNYYGYTSYLLDVYEGNEFFEWVHRVDSGVNDSEYNQYLRTEFDRLIDLLSPLPTECVIFKNARAYSTVTRLHRAVPEILFVRVRRDRGQVIESVLRAFRELGSFHPVPPSLQTMMIEDPLEFAFAQIEAIEVSLDEQFSHLPPSSQFQIPYETFCERPYEFINMLADDFLKLPPGSVRECAALTMLKPSRRRKVSEAERLKIQTLIQKTKHGNGFRDA